jgi:hypothetical protein
VIFFEKVRLSLKKFFTELPVLEAGFQISAGRIEGCLVKERTNFKPVVFSEELPPGSLEPSFHKRNIRQREIIKEIFRKGLEKINPEKKNIAFLPPELSLKVFVLHFESMPSAETEVEKVILFAVRKQQPLLPQDIRLSYQIMPENGRFRVVGVLARRAVIDEYEELFASLGFQVKLITPPTISLFQLLKEPGEGLVMNIEPDSWGGFVFAGERIVFYRQKTFAYNWGEKGDQDWESVIQEIETTARFIEDKEELKLDRIIIRNTLPGKKEVLYSRLEEKFGLMVNGIEDYVEVNLNSEDKTAFAPLFGVLR